MKRIQNNLIGIDHGDVVMFSDFEHDGIMWSGEGARQVRAHVEFSESFRAPPAVTTTISMFDISNGANARVDVHPEAITNNGFAVICRTWSDTRIARVRVAWQALGELRHADEWELD